MVHKIRKISRASESASQGNGLNMNALAPFSRNCCSTSFAERPQMMELTPLERIARTVSVPSNCFSTLAICTVGKINSIKRRDQKMRYCCAYI